MTSVKRKASFWRLHGRWVCVKRKEKGGDGAFAYMADVTGAKKKKEKNNKKHDKPITIFSYLNVFTYILE